MSLEKLKEILPIARGRLQAHHDLLRGHAQTRDPFLQVDKTRGSIGQVSRFHHHLFLGSQNGKAAGFTADINADDIRKR